MEKWCLYYIEILELFSSIWKRMNVKELVHALRTFTDRVMDARRRNA